MFQAYSRFIRRVAILLGVCSIVLPGSGLCAARAATRQVAAASALVNIFPDTAPDAKELSDTIQVNAADNERRSAQIVIMAGDADLAIDRIAVSDLTGPSTLRQENVEVRLVGYVKVPEKSGWRGIVRPGYWPDPLLAFEPFTCPKGNNRSLWLTVYVPAGTTAGHYRGTVTLYHQDQTVAALPLSVHVYPFAIPRLPMLQTAYWNNLRAADYPDSRAAFQQMLQLFGQYRTSTNVWDLNGTVQWFKEKDGTITCDMSAMKDALELLDRNGCTTLNIGRFNEANLPFDPARVQVIDRATGKAVASQELKTLPPDYFARMYLHDMCDWLASKGWLERSYIQLHDEVPNPAEWPAVRELYTKFRTIEPRIRLLSVNGIHPSLQGYFDIWSPHHFFADRAVYDHVRKGESLYGPKNIQAKVHASSTGGWPNPSFYRYQPVDAYDGCDYTRWTSAKVPTEQNPQWIQFDFEKASTINAIRILPYECDLAKGRWSCLVSLDSEHFDAVETVPVSKEKDATKVFKIPAGAYKSIRIVWTQSAGIVGVREVEFVSPDVPAETPRQPQKVRPSELWEYYVGADYPSVTVNSDPTESGASAWQCWLNGTVGYLNYGAAQWQMKPATKRPQERDPLFWDYIGEGYAALGSGSSMIVYPGHSEVLPSIRFARFRDGLQDYDYLKMLEMHSPTHPLLQQLRLQGKSAFDSEANLTRSRSLLANALSAFAR